MREVIHKAGKIFLLIILTLLFNPRCKKIEESVIPSVSFSYIINMTLHNEVNIAGNSIFIPNLGYGGVIVYCEMPGSFFAYDATCTYEANKSCKVVNEGVLGTCSCCGSEYLLIGGGIPSTGPAQEGLRQYYTTVTNEILRIYNP